MPFNVQFASLCKALSGVCSQSHENFEIDEEIFRQKIIDHSNHQKRPANPLISEYSVNLNEHQMKIGCNPFQYFEIAVQIESSANRSVELTVQEFTTIVDVLTYNFDPDYKKLIINNASFNGKLNIYLEQTECRSFTICIGQKQFSIDEETIAVLLQKILFIMNYIEFLEKEIRSSREKMLLTLLIHFFHECKTLKRATEASYNANHLQQFFEEFIIFHPDCVDKSFTLEIASNYSNWFAQTAQLFFKTAMVNERERLKTFSDGWPHHKKKFINVKMMAKSGLYFTGEGDVAACAFCGTTLHEWRYGDNPIMDHYKYSWMCPFLNEPKKTCNIPIENDSEIDEMLSIIPRFVNLSIDTPDKI